MFSLKAVSAWNHTGVMNLLSIVIPAHNEEADIGRTVLSLHSALEEEQINHEILVVNDNSSDGTEDVLRRLQCDVPELRYVNNAPPNGYGWAVRKGLAEFRGDAVAVVMADGSDDPRDVVAFYRKLGEGYDCVFGTRFSLGGKTYDYPLPKLVLNRMANLAIRLAFWIKYDDVTNAFKMYRRSVIAGLHPLISQHFNLTVELPLKCIARGFRYAVVPNSWYNCKKGISKFSIKEMGSRYVFIIAYCLLEKLLVPQDSMAYRRLMYDKDNPWHTKEAQGR